MEKGQIWRRAKATGKRSGGFCGKFCTFVNYEQLKEKLEGLFGTGTAKHENI
jgi:hypothetical protein